MAAKSTPSIQCGGVVVKPGDLIVADSNGILVLDPEAARPLGERALAMQEREKGSDRPS